MNTENAKDTGTNPQPTYLFNVPNMKIIQITLNITMWPANMFAKRRIINATGLMQSDMISINTNRHFTKNGTLGGLSRWLQKCLLLLAIITMKVINAKQAVTAILPVKFAPPGNKPKRLFIQIKKKFIL